MLSIYHCFRKSFGWFERYIRCMRKRKHERFGVRMFSLKWKNAWHSTSITCYKLNNRQGCIIICICLPDTLFIQSLIGQGGIFKLCSYLWLVKDACICSILLLIGQLIYNGSFLKSLDWSIILVFHFASDCSVRYLSILLLLLINWLVIFLFSYYFWCG